MTVSLEFSKCSRFQVPLPCTPICVCVCVCQRDVSSIEEKGRTGLAVCCTCTCRTWALDLARLTFGKHSFLFPFLWSVSISSVSIISKLSSRTHTHTSLSLSTRSRSRLDDKALVKSIAVGAIFHIRRGRCCRKDHHQHSLSSL